MSSVRKIKILCFAFFVTLCMVGGGGGDEGFFYFLLFFISFVLAVLPFLSFGLFFNNHHSHQPHTDAAIYHNRFFIFISYG